MLSSMAGKSTQTPVFPLSPISTCELLPYTWELTADEDCSLLFFDVVTDISWFKVTGGNSPGSQPTCSSHAELLSELPYRTLPSYHLLSFPFCPQLLVWVILWCMHLLPDH